MNNFEKLKKSIFEKSIEKNDIEKAFLEWKTEGFEFFSKFRATSQRVPGR